MVEPEKQASSSLLAPATPATDEANTSGYPHEENARKDREEADAWYERYRMAQPNQKVLSAKDPHFVNLVATFRREKKAKEAEVKKQEAIQAALEVANPKLAKLNKRKNDKQKNDKQKRSFKQIIADLL